MNLNLLIPQSLKMWFVALWWHGRTDPETFLIILIQIFGSGAMWVIMSIICCRLWNTIWLCYAWIVYNAGDMDRKGERLLDHVWVTANFVNIRNWSLFFCTGSFYVYYCTYIYLVRDERVAVGTPNRNPFEKSWFSQKDNLKRHPLFFTKETLQVTFTHYVRCISTFHSLIVGRSTTAICHR